MPDGNGAAVRVDAAVIESDAQAFQAGEHLHRERFVNLDHIHVLDAESDARHRLLRGRHRAYAHDARQHAGRGARDHPYHRLHAGLLAHAEGAHHQRRRAVVYARSIAGGDHPALIQRLHRGERGQVALRTRVLVLAHHHGITLLLRDAVRRDLAVEELVALGCGVFRLRRGREAVGLLARDAVLFRQIVGGLRHLLVAVQFHQLRVGKTRADGAVEQAHVAAEGAIDLVQHERGAAHALHATGNEHLAFAGGDRVRRVRHRAQAAGAIALQHRARDFDRQAGR